MDVALASSGSAVTPTKLHVPVLAPGALVPCQPLAGPPFAAHGRRLALVLGPSGGDAEAPARWAAALAEEQRFAWLALDPEDADPVSFWRGAIAALRTVHLGFGAEAQALLRAGPAVLEPAVVPLVAAEAAALDRPVMLILDGSDALADAAAVSATLATLLDLLPPARLLAVGPPTTLRRARTGGTPSARIDAALAAGNEGGAAQLVAHHWQAALARGEHGTVLAWLEALPAPAADGEPDLWLVRLWAALERDAFGPANSDLVVADPALPRAVRARGLLLTALGAFRRGDLVGMTQSIDRAAPLDPEDGFWHTTEALLRGLEAFWRGHPRVAHRHLARAAGLADIHGDRLALAYATGYLALIAAEGNDHDAARRRLGRLEDLRDADPVTGEHAVACSGALAEGRMLELAGAYEGAVAPLERAHALARRGASRLEQAEPLLRLASVHRACHRPEQAGALDAEAQRLLATCPDHGRLAGPAAAVAPPRSRETLSPSELSVLRLLPSGLSQREIGAELYLSVNTVKTHCRNIYTKLHAGSREQAVARANELGLL